MALGIIIGILIVHTLLLAEIYLNAKNGAIGIFSKKVDKYIEKPSGFIVEPKTDKQVALEKLDEEAGEEGTKYEDLIK